MKIYLMAAFIFLGCSNATAQVEKPDSHKDSSFLNELKKNLMETKQSLAQSSVRINDQFRLNLNGILDSFVFNKFLDEKFTYLSFERGALPTANSASLDLLDNETQLKLTLAKKFTNATGRTATIISTGVKAKLGDGIAELFNGNVATGGTTLFLNFSSLQNVRFRTVLNRRINNKMIPTPFSILLPKLTKLKNEYDDEYGYEFDTKYGYLVQRLEIIQQQLLSDKSEPSCCEELKAEELHDQKTYDSLSGEYNKSSDPKIALVLKTISLRILLLKSEYCLCKKDENEPGKSRMQLYKEKDEIIKQLTEIGLIGDDASGIAKAAEDKYQAAHFALYTKSAPWDWYKLRWLSGGVTYTRDAYTTYDGTLNLAKRFGSKDFNSWGLKLTSNWYQEKSKKTGFLRAWYGNISYEPSLINSYSDINAQDILKNVVAASVLDTTYLFQTNKKAKNITNIPYTTSWKHSFSSAFTAMFFDKKNVGINLLFQTGISKISKPIFNAHTGIIFSMANSDYDPDDKKSKSTINFELFLQFNDMSDVSKSEKSVWQNRVLGISTNIPFSKIFLK